MKIGNRYPPFKKKSPLGEILGSREEGGIVFQAEWRPGLNLYLVGKGFVKDGFFLGRYAPADIARVLKAIDERPNAAPSFKHNPHTGQRIYEFQVYHIKPLKHAKHQDADSSLGISLNYYQGWESDTFGPGIGGPPTAGLFELTKRSPTWRPMGTFRVLTLKCWLEYGLSIFEGLPAIPPPSEVKTAH